VDLLGGPTARQEVDGGFGHKEGGLDGADDASGVEAGTGGGMGGGSREGFIPLSGGI